MKATATLFNAAQGHAVFSAWWPQLKEQLLSGKKLELSVRPQRRSLDQNAKFHALCEDAARAGLAWAGKPRSAAEWKVLFVSGHAAATNLGAEIVAGLEGEFVNIRESTAAMDKARGSSLIEYTVAYLAQHGVEVSQ
jgi:hypothetical protein